MSLDGAAAGAVARAGAQETTGAPSRRTPLTPDVLLALALALLAALACLVASRRIDPRLANPLAADRLVRLRHSLPARGDARAGRMGERRRASPVPVDRPRAARLHRALPAQQRSDAPRGARGCGRRGTVRGGALRPLPQDAARAHGRDAVSARSPRPAPARSSGFPSPSRSASPGSASRSRCSWPLPRARPSPRSSRGASRARAAS